MSRIYLWLLRNKSVIVLGGAIVYEILKEIFERDDPPPAKPKKKLIPKQ